MIKILIAVDGSDPAGRAIHAAARWRQEAVPLQVVLVNVRQQAGFHGDLPTFDMRELEARLESDQTALLEASSTHARLAGLESVRCRATLGNPAEEVIRVAREEVVDFIFMGTRGMTALGGLLIGSVAQRVVHGAAVPVLLAK